MQIDANKTPSSESPDRYKPVQEIAVLYTSHTQAK